MCGGVCCYVLVADGKSYALVAGLFVGVCVGVFASSAGMYLCCIIHYVRHVISLDVRERSGGTPVEAPQPDEE